MPCKFGGSKLDFAVAPLPLASNYNASSMAGSYAMDLALGKYTLSWDSLSSMDIWLAQEQQSKFIELRLKERERNKRSDKWTEKLIYVCARHGTGGKSKYKKKKEDRGRNIPSKRCGCTSRLIVKCYPNTEQVLGLYEATHSHPIGQDNARFMRLPEETRVRIAEMLRMGVTHEHIVRNGSNTQISTYLTFHSCSLYKEISIEMIILQARLPPAGMTSSHLGTSFELR